MKRIISLLSVIILATLSVVTYPQMKSTENTYNLTCYIGLIQEGQDRMHEIYENLVKQKRDAAVAANPFMPASQPEKKVLS